LRFLAIRISALSAHSRWEELPLDNTRTETVDKTQFLEEYTESLVEKWDDYVDWEARAEAEGTFFRDLLKQHDVKRVLDAATGTGYHAVKLRQAGFDVDASDGSPNMVEKAKENAEKHGVTDVDFRVADWTKLPNVFKEGAYDAVVCLGNSFTHLHKEADQEAALAGMIRMLRPGGILVLDQRNYDKILDKGYSASHKYYYRGENMDGKPEEISEEILRFKCVDKDGNEYPLTLKPVRQATVTRLLKGAGFKIANVFGDFREPFDKHAPDFIIHVAKKA
jgi:ubiquinone/menaquinone biosynthesis C-methylase UbiE